MIRKAILLAMILIGVRTEPQGPTYLPPGPRQPGNAGASHPDEWAGDPASYEFSYEVQEAATGLDFGHRETWKGKGATGTYHVLLPDGRTQIVDYIADEAGYRPMVRYEGTATYPAQEGGQVSQSEGYKY